FSFFFQAEDGIRDFHVTGVQTCALPIWTHQMTLAKMDEAYGAEADIKNAQLSQAESELRFHEKQANSNRDLLVRLERLSKSGGRSEERRVGKEGRGWRASRQ